MKKIISYICHIILLCLLLSLSTSANAGLYEGCIHGNIADTSNTANIIVRAIGESCLEQCDAQCQIFSRACGGYGEINQDIIDRCIISCRKGNIHSEKVREPLINNMSGGNTTYVWSDKEVSTVSACPTAGIGSADHNFYPTNVYVKEGDTFSVDVINPPGSDGNIVHLCGKQTVYLEPNRNKLPSMLSQWVQNPLIVNSLRDAAFIPELSKLWDPKNPYFTDTGIDIKDKDFLSISYIGEYRYMCDSNYCAKCWGQVKCDCGGKCALTDKSNFSSSNSYDLLIRAPSQNMWQQGTAMVIPGNSLKLNDKGTLDISNLSKHWKGLLPYAATAEEPHYGRVERVTKFYGYLGMKLQTAPNALIDFGYDFNNATIGDSFSPRHVRLGLKHYDEGVFVNWIDNIGGFFVTIDWRGCSYFNGDRLQYAVLSKDDNNLYITNNIKWIDIPRSSLKKDIKAQIADDSLKDRAGEVVLRVKPLDITEFEKFKPDCNKNDTICRNSILDSQNRYNSYNAHGQYYILVKGNIPHDVLSQVSTIVKNLKVYLFGEHNKGGIVKDMFLALVTDNALIKTIRALLVLYMAFTGFSFMIGIAQLTQREAAIRLVKITIVLMLISDQSWIFFHDYLFVIFIEGMNSIIAHIAVPIYASPDIKARILEDTSNVFLVFDTPFKELLNIVTWYRVLALAMSGIVGFMLAAALGIAIFIFLLTLFKVIIIYMVSIFIIAILIMLSPIFISMVLFGYTKNIFDLWIKQLLSCVFQPIFIFTAMSLLLHLLMVMFHYSTNFTICKACFLGFQLPILTPDNGFICFIPGFVTLFNAHMPFSNLESIFTTPITQFGAVLMFLIIAQAMYAFCSFVTGLAINIATGQFVGFDFGQVTEGFKTASIVTQDVLSAAGLERRTQAGISQARKHRRDTWKKKMIKREKWDYKD